MLLLADAGFYSWQLWHDAAATGAALVWRIGAERESARRPAPCLTVPTWALLFAPHPAKTARPPGTAERRPGRGGGAARNGHSVVRAVEFTVPDRDPDGELVCLITTVLDPARIERRRAGRRLRPAVGARIGAGRDQDPPARWRPGPSQQVARHGRTGDLRTPAGPLRRPGTDVPGGRRGRPRPRPAVVHPLRPRRPPPGHRPGGLFPLSTYPRPPPTPLPRSPSRPNPRRRHRTYPRVIKRARHNGSWSRCAFLRFRRSTDSKECPQPRVAWSGTQ